MSRYEKDRIIGSGSFGNVWLVKSTLSWHTYVLKEINLRALSEAEKQQALTEVVVLAKCKHKNIIKYKERIVGDNILSIIMEYAEGGDLASAIRKQRGVPFKEHRIMSWFTQICLALQYIHYQNILHRDLKSQNIFLTRSRVIKVGDFGIARVLRGPDDLANTTIGTPYYLSPEIFQRQPYNNKCDIWALGCVLYELVTLQYAFNAVDLIDLKSMVCRGIKGRLPCNCNPFIQQLIGNLLEVESNARPSTDEILMNPFLQPYLSEYMTTQDKNGFPPLFGTTTETHTRRVTANDALVANSRRVSVSDVFKVVKDNCLKRKNSGSSVNPKAPKQRTIPAPKHGGKVKSRTCVDSRPHTSKNCQKSSPSRGSGKSEKEQTYKISNTKFILQLEDQKNDLVLSCDTYILNESVHCDPSNLTKSENFSSNAAYDYGYHTKENELSNDGFLNTDCKGITSDSAIHSSPMDFDDKLLRSDNSPSLDTRSRTKLSPDKSTHNHCPHTQCHECMLDMLWKNRIRGCVGMAVDTNEYHRLKNKLLLVYKDELFPRVYQSLTYDWERSEQVTSRNRFKRIVNELNYEQVQSLPLMMQLIQLDLLVRRRK